jgi:hypothetical protein
LGKGKPRLARVSLGAHGSAYIGSGR